MSDTAVHVYARDRHFSAGTTARWLERGAADRDALLWLAQTLRLGENQFRDLLDALDGIAGRRGASIAAVLGEPPVRDVLAGSLGRNEKVKAVKRCLRRLRYPQLSAVEARLAAVARGLDLPTGVRVEFPENLEGEHVAVVLRAASAAELRAQAAALAAAVQGEGVDELFALLDGRW